MSYEIRRVSVAHARMKSTCPSSTDGEDCHGDCEFDKHLMTANIEKGRFDVAAAAGGDRNVRR